MAIMVEFEIDNGVAVLSLSEPRIARLDAAARAALLDAIDKAEEADEAQAIILLFQGRAAVLGLAVEDVGLGNDEPSLADLCERLDHCDKPVIAALDGIVRGAGAELALAARHRVAGPSLRFGFPEIALGLVPCAGGSQRLPRLIGGAAALKLLLSGRLVAADDPALAGLFTTAPQGGLVQAARALASGDDGRPTCDRRDGFADMTAYLQAVATARAALPGSATEAAARIVALVDAAPVLPFEAGLAMEQDAFADCAEAPAAKALRHLAVAEHRLRQVTEDAHPVPEHVTLLGSNALAVQLVATLLAAGLPVRWDARDATRLERGRGALADLPGITPELLCKLTIGPGTDRDGGLCILAARGQAPIAASGDCIQIEAMLGAVEGVGMRFVAPVRSSRVVEILQGPGATPEAIDAAMGLVRRLGRMAIVQRSAGAHAAGRLAGALHRAVDGLIDMGADPYALDEALEQWGLGQGPLLQRDILGLAGFANAPRAAGGHNWSAELLEIERGGRAVGHGFYKWDENGQASADRAVQGVLNGARKPAPMARARMCDLVLAALANEGARLLSEGKLSDAADIDVISTHALHMARNLGGVMFAAGQAGLFPLMKALERVEHPDTEFWRPEPLWADLVKNGQTFADAPGP